MSGRYDIYIAFKMTDVAAASGGKSSENSKKYRTFYGAPNWCYVYMVAGCLLVL
jgi:hypothetical protein